MFQFLAPLLGGLGGLLFPAAGAAAGGAAATGLGALLSKAALPALGAGLGTLVSGGNGKDAIRNALMMGAGVTALPGLAKGIQQSEFGKGITGGLADIFGMGEPEAGGANVGERGMQPPRHRPEGLGLPGAAPATMSTSGGEAPAGFGISAMEADARGRAPTTLPSLYEMSRIDDASRERRAAEAFDLARSIPVEMPTISGGISGMEADARGRFSDTPMPPTGIEARNSDLATALRMAQDASLSGNTQGAMDLLDIYNRRYQGRGFAMGGEIAGPGNGTSDSVPAQIYQDGKPVQKAALSDGEFVMTAKAVKGAGNGSRDRGVSRMYELMRRFESGEMA